MDQSLIDQEVGTQIQFRHNMEGILAMVELPVRWQL